MMCDVSSYFTAKQEKKQNKNEYGRRQGKSKLKYVDFELGICTY